MSVPIYNWHCLRCGECCIKTTHPTPFGKIGIFLMPEETKLFPDILVKPLYAVGIKGRARPRPQAIFAYQMIYDTCPHYNASDHSCKIYTYRPLICREFPISGSFGRIMVHRECPAVQKYIPNNVPIKPNQLKGFDNEFKAVHASHTYFNLVYVFNMYRADVSYTWFYDFQRKVWQYPTEEQLVQALGELRKHFRRPKQ